MSDFDDILNQKSATERSGGQISKDDYANKKKAEREEVFALSDKLALDVSCDGNKFKQYLNVQSKFDRYSAVNALLLMAQKPDATRVGSFDFWKEPGGYIKTGETAISILEPHEYSKDDGSTGTGYNVKKVFDISQVDAKKVKEPAQSPKCTNRQLLQALVHKAPVAIVGVETMPDYVPKGQNAIYELLNKQILVKKGMEFSETFQSLAQELALAEIGQNTNATPNNPQFTAYCSAYILCNKYGVDTNKFSFFNAPDLLGGLEAQEVKKELTKIRNVAESISSRMYKHLDSVSKAEKSTEAR